MKQPLAFALPLVVSVFLSASSPTYAATQYEIEAAVNDEKFIINGEVYEAQVYCLGWEQGERVIFVDGSALGICVSATLFNVDRRETCEVWCE